MELIAIFLLSIIVAFFLIKQRKKNVREVHRKKDLIIQEYKNQLKELLEKSPKENRAKVKTDFLKKCNEELSRNIYFEHNEIHTVLNKLLKV